jgi:hypothetical protein
MRTVRHALPLALALAAASSASAQSPATGSVATPAAFPGGASLAPSARPGGVRLLATGDVVRIVSSAGRYSGRIVRITPDTVVVGATGRIDAIPRSEVTRLERFTGKSSRGRAILIGAGAGLVGGGALGAVAGRRAGRIDCRPDDEPCTPGEHDSTIQGALLAEGAIIGALVGAMLGPTFRREHWERAEDGFPLAAGAAPTGGVALGVTLRF